jgi:hypothetical protein
MSMINLSLKHGRTLEEARLRMAKVVADVNTRFALLVNSVIWSEDRNEVVITGPGFEVRMRVDEQFISLWADVALLGRLLSGPLAEVLKGLVERHFPPRLP